ncbi:MAG: tetratricopeptide repeat protein [Phaeodactylibacter sp.]|nr:tetratricopeptide repeat protein [Phaeodactylibacter sp.]MCB9048555.1 tetratricopeptide repeat protein [Lewinellaceae bacterium]
MRYLIYFLLLFTAFLLLFCSRELPEATGGQYLNLAEGVQYVGMNTCKSCHPNVHATFIHTGMGRSFDRATRQKSDATFGEHALAYDTASNLYYKPFFRDSVMYVLEFRLEGGDTVHQRLERIDYIVGSGQHTNSHIVDFNGYIYQAPVTYYTQEGRWDMAPGFRGDNIRFGRLLTAECITCHNHLPDLVEGSLNKYSRMPTGIECERCHGPGEVHAREKLAGHIVDTSKFIDYTIVTPSDLSRDLQMDLCQRCHLQGIAVLNEGKDFFDFKPGMRLQEVFNVFLPRYTNSHERFIMASQADRLRLSPCYLQSDMTCITCHNPHQSIEATDKSRYNNACLNCHGKQRQAACSAPMAERLAEEDDCSGCHMPRSGSIDIPHVNITDHYISRSNVKGRERQEVPSGSPDFLGLQILTKEKATPLEMAKGYLALYDKYVQSAVMLDSAWFYLGRSDASPGQKQATLLHYYFAREDYPAIVELAAPLQPRELTDGWAAYHCGEAYYKTGDFSRALSFYQRATSLLPYNLDFQEKMGAAYIQHQQLPKAIETLEWVLKENPKRPVALSNLGYACVLQGQFQQAESFYDRAIALDPDYEQALLNKAAVRLLQKDTEEAKKLIERVLKINPENRQALAIWGQL